MAMVTEPLPARRRGSSWYYYQRRRSSRRNDEDEVLRPSGPQKRGHNVFIVVVPKGTTATMMFYTPR